MDGHLSAYKHPVLATKFYRNLVYLRLFGGDLGRFNLGSGKSDSHKSTFVLQNDDYELIIETLTHSYVPNPHRLGLYSYASPHTSPYV